MSVFLYTIDEFFSVLEPLILLLALASLIVVVVMMVERWQEKKVEKEAP